MLASEDKIMSVLGLIDEMHVLSAVRTAPIVGYLPRVCFSSTFRSLSKKSQEPVC
jgi:hypothetical protein